MTTSRSEMRRLSTLAAEKVKFCPGCGYDELEFDALALDNSETPYNPVFDALCKKCGWSGDISPDLEIK